jgi:hypothetical protein
VCKYTETPTLTPSASDSAYPWLTQTGFVMEIESTDTSVLSGAFTFSYKG